MKPIVNDILIVEYEYHSKIYSKSCPMKPDAIGLFFIQRLNSIAQ